MLDLSPEAIKRGKARASINVDANDWLAAGSALREALHDVSKETRDAAGRWVKGARVVVTGGYLSGKHGRVLSADKDEPDFAVVRTDDGAEGLVKHSELVGEGVAAFHGKGVDAYFLGGLPVPVGEREGESPVPAEYLKEYGEAIREGVKLHPELLTGDPPLSRVGFLSEPENENARAVLGSTGTVIATGYNPSWEGQRIVINDLMKPELASAKHLAAATRTPRGCMTHELGHVFFRVHGLGDTQDVAAAFGRYGITPRMVSGVSQYAAANPNEAVAELYAQTFTPGFKIEDADTRKRFLQMVSDLRGNAMVPTEPTVVQEIQKAAMANLAANDWVADFEIDPTLDEAWSDVARAAALRARQLKGRMFGHSSELGVTPFREGEDEPNHFYDSKKYKQFEGDVRSAAKENGVYVRKVERADGVWQGGSEPSARVVLKDGDEAVRHVSDLVGAKYNQDGVLRFREDQKGDQLRMVSDRPVDPERVKASKSLAALPGATVRADKHLEVVVPPEDVEKAHALFKEAAGGLSSPGTNGAGLYHYHRGYGEYRSAGEHYKRWSEQGRDWRDGPGFALPSGGG